MNPRTLALVLAGVVILSAAGSPLAAGSFSDSTTESAIDRPTPLDHDPASSDHEIDYRTGATIDDSVDRSGTVEVIVRFSDADLTDRSRTTATATLQSHASDTQAPFDSFAADRSAVTIEQDFWIANAKLVRVDTDRVSLDALARVDHVTSIHENVQVNVSSARTDRSGPTLNETTTTTATAPNASDPTYGSIGSTAEATADSISDPETLSNGENGTYGLDMINASEVWETYDQRGENATVAVLDTGVNNSSHSDLDPAGWAEFDAGGSRMGTTPNDGDGHGTHTSGTVVGNTTDNGTHYGVAPNATLIHGKVLNDGGGGTFASVVAGMEWAVTHETSPDVLSMSIGFPEEQRFIEPVRNAREAGVVVVASTGNTDTSTGDTGQGHAGDPSAVYDLLAVGAVNSAGDVADFSNGKTIDTSSRWGAYAPADWPESYVVPDVTAPGVDVYSAAPDGGYQAMNGTSMATPHVAGIAALIRSEHQDISEAGVRERINATAEHPDGDKSDDRYGEGIVNATAALEARDATVNGTVSVNGSAAEGVTVTAGSGYTTTTDATGAYELAVPSGTVDVSIDPFGWATNTSSTTVDAGNTSTVNLSTADRTMETELIEHPGHYARPADNVTLTYRTANVESYNVSLLAGSEAAENNATLYVEGTPRNSGENVDLSGGPDERVNVTVEPEPDYYGEFALQHNFTNTSVQQATTTPTKVHPDPVVVPKHVESTSLQNVSTWVEPYTTVEVNTTTPLTIDAENNVVRYVNGEPETAGLDLSNPITLTMAPESAPIEFKNDSSNTAFGIYTPAGPQGTTISNVTIDGGGVTTGIINYQADAAITNNTVENTSYGIENYASDPVQTVTNNTIDHVDTGGIWLSGPVDTVEGNQIGTNAPENPSDGIVAFASVNSISNNDIEASRNGVYLDGNIGSVEKNSIGSNSPDGPDDGIYVTGTIHVDGSVKSIADNDIEANRTGIHTSYSDAFEVEAITNNTVTGHTGTGLDLSGGNITDVRQNTIINGTDGIDASTPNISISNNTIENVSESGIFVFSDSAAVADNDINNSREGVLLDGNDSVVEGTTVQNVDFGIITFSVNSTIVDSTVDKTFVDAIWVESAENVTVENATLDTGGIDVQNSVNVTATNVTVSNATWGIDVGSDGPSTNVSIDDVTIENTSQELILSNRISATVSNVSVVDSTGSDPLTFEDVDPADVAVENLVLPNGTTVSASGHNATLDESSDPGSHPDDLTAVGPFLELDSAGSSPELDVEVPYDGTALADVENSTMAMYRHDNGQWSTAGTSSFDGTTLTTAGITSFSTFGVLGEPPTPNFTVSNLTAPTSAVQSDPITVNATITNEGSDSGTQTIEYVLDGTARNSTDVTLDPDESTNVSLDWSIPGDFAPGDYDHGIHSANDSQTARLSIDEETGWVAGTVTANHTGSGIDGASIVVEANGSTYSTTADTNGEYNLSVPTTDSATVTADHPDYDVNQTGSVSVTRNTTTTVDLALDPLDGRIEGSITDNVTGDVVGDATVTVTEGGTTIDSTTSTASGYGLDVPAGTYNVTIGHANFTTTTVSSVTVGANETVTLDRALDPLPGALAWTVTSNQTGVELGNTTVTLSNGTTVNQTTAGNGTFDPVERATGYTLEFANADYDTVTRTVDVGPNETGTIAESLDSLPGTVGGTVTAESGGTLANATVHVERTNRSNETGPNGTFLIENVPADRDQTINATARGYGSNATTVPIPANGSVAQNATLTQRDHYFGVDSVSAPDIDAGDSVTVEALVTNFGAQDWNATVELQVDGSTAARTKRALNASANETVALSTTIDDAGDHELAIVTPNETVSTTITVDSGGSISIGSGVDISEEETQSGDTSGTTFTPVEPETTTTSEPEPTDEPTSTTATDTTASTIVDTTTADGPGFGMLLALLAALALGARRVRS